MYYVMRASAPSLHRESTDSLIYTHCWRMRLVQKISGNLDSAL